MIRDDCQCTRVQPGCERGQTRRRRGPVVITDRGEPAYVLLSIADYEQMRDRRSLLDALQMDDDVEFEPVVADAPGQPTSRPICSTPTSSVNCANDRDK